MDNLNNNAYGSDKCPKCGALKVFSAIRCPSCGTDYAAAARPAASGGNTYVNQPTNNFDLNASFSAYKRSIEPQAEASAEAALGSAAAGVQNAESSLSNIAELNKPMEMDPIAKKLQQMSGPGSAAPVGGAAQGAQAAQTARPAYQSTQNMYAQNQSAPIPGVWVPGMQSAGQGAASTQGQQAAPNSAQGAAPQGMRFQGRPTESQVGGYTGAPAGGASPYASPYASSNYGAMYGNSITEKPKKSIGGKIFVGILLLALCALIGYGGYKYTNCDKNENGVSYTEGKSENRMYVNEWADLKIDLSKDFDDFTPYLYTSSMQSSINSLSYQWKDKDAEVKGIFLSGKEYHDGFANGPLPAVMMYVITDNSFDAKLFGAKTEDFFQEYRVTGGGYTLTVSKSSDMVICGKTYKTFVSSLPLGNGTNVTMYMCVRAIGNKIVLLYLYDIPGYFDLSKVKSSFVD